MTRPTIEPDAAVEIAIAAALDRLPKSSTYRTHAISVMLSRAWALANCCAPTEREWWAKRAYEIADDLAARGSSPTPGQSDE